MDVPAAAPRSNSATIARNSFWYGIETGFGIFTALATSIAMARVLGPAKLGYFNYIMWLTNISGLIGSMGVPTAARKYMAEYLGRGDGGTARAVFFHSLKLQSITSFVIGSVGLVLVFTVVDPAQRMISAFQVASVIPAMVIFIPAQANMAAENMAANVAGSLVGQSLYIFCVILSLVFGWDLLGIAAGILFYRVVEFLVRIVPVVRWIRKFPEARLSPELRRRTRTFAGQGMVLLLLNVVVWDRSDMVFLKWFCKDISQISFFSVAFNLAEKGLLVPQTVAAAIGASLMAQYGRDKLRLPQLVSAALRFLMLFALPVMLGLAALSPAVIPAVYGRQYLPAILPLAIAAVLAIPKALILPAQQSLQATENQGFLIWWGLLCGALNVLLDVLLIPHWQATGAVVANGSAQTIAAIGTWVRAWQLLHPAVNAGRLAKLGLSGLVMATIVSAVTLSCNPWLALVLGGSLGVVVFPLLLRVTKALDAGDRQPFELLRRAIPVPIMRRWLDQLLDWVVPIVPSERDSA